LGGSADRELFQALRSVSDAIVVGSQTVRAERYRPPQPGSARAQARRAERGQNPRPRLVVVSASLDFDLSLPVFGEPDHGPLIATTHRADPARRAALSRVAEVVDAGDGQVEPATLLALLFERGVRVVMCEGGPTLNGQLIAAGLIDEWNLTVAPLLISGDAARAAHGPPLLAPPGPMNLDRVWLADDLLFCRWVRP
jgi:riboflavin-specific deaminase-like protein